MSNLESIRTLVLEMLRSKGDAGAVTDSDSLVLSGRLSSVEVMELVVALETRFGLDLADRGFDPADFDSIETIAALVGHTAAA